MTSFRNQGRFMPILPETHRPHLVEYQLTPEQLESRLAQLPKQPDFGPADFKLPRGVSSTRTPRTAAGLLAKGYVTGDTLRRTHRKNPKEMARHLANLRVAYPRECVKVGTGWFYSPMAQKKLTLMLTRA